MSAETEPAAAKQPDKASEPKENGQAGYRVEQKSRPQVDGFGGDGRASKKSKTAQNQEKRVTGQYGLLEESSASEASKKSEGQDTDTSNRSEQETMAATKDTEYVNGFCSKQDTPKAPAFSFGGSRAAKYSSVNKLSDVKFSKESQPKFGFDGQRSPKHQPLGDGQKDKLAEAELSKMGIAFSFSEADIKRCNEEATQAASVQLPPISE